jgi:hypothetical protein
MANYSVLSYASADADRVLGLRDSLAARGVQVWMDRTDIIPGTNWQKSIESAIRECAVLVVVISNASVLSREVEAEWTLALSLGKTVIPVVIDPDAEMPFRLATLQYLRVDATRSAAVVDDLVNFLPRTNEPLSYLVGHSKAFEMRQREPKRFMNITLWLDDDSLGMNAERHLLIDRARFGTVKSLLDHIYLQYLSKKVKPYSYGADWLLCGPALVVPFKWMMTPGATIESVDLEWSSATPISTFELSRDWGIFSGSAVRGRLAGGVFGAVANNPATISALGAHPKSVGWLLCCQDLFEAVEPKLVVPQKYAFTMVQTAWFEELAGKVFCETPAASRNDEILRERWKTACRLA